MGARSRRVAQLNAGEPGFGLSACEHLVDRKILLTGADTWGVFLFVWSPLKMRGATGSPGNPVALY